MARQTVAVVEFMMMENYAAAQRDGIVDKLFVRQCDRVNVGDQIALIS